MPVYVGDILTQIILRATLTVPLGNPPVLKIKYRKPDGSTGEWEDATVYQTYYVKKIVANGDLDQSGLWTFQVYAELESGWKGHGEEYQEWLYSPIQVA